MTAIVLSVLMLAGIALGIGGIVALHRRDTKKGALMLVLSFVAFANVVIWVAPTKDGRTLAQPGAMAR